MEKYNSPANLPKSEIAKLNVALQKMSTNIAAEEIAVKNLSAKTVEALKDFHKKISLEPTTDVVFNEDTVRTLKNELTDIQYATNKYRTAKLHNLLASLDIQVPPEEKQARKFSVATRDAIGEFQKRVGLPTNELVSDELITRLENEVVKKTYSSKTKIQNLHTQLLKVGKIGKLNLQISDDELKSKTLGPSSVAALKAFQVKYKLPETGHLDKATLDKLQSVAASKGVRKAFIKKPDPSQLAIVRSNLRLNAVSAKVVQMQRTLSYLGYSIDEKEFKTNTFGKTTRNAVIAFQKQNNLPQTGHIEGATLKLLNKIVSKTNPEAITSTVKYRIRGSVRDEVWQRKPNMVIRVYEKLLSGESEQPLVTKKNHTNGFFDITYNPPIDKTTGKVKENYHLVVKLFEPQDNNPANDKLISTQVHYNVNRIHWANFTTGDAYQGDSEFAVFMRQMKKALGQIKIEELQETTANKQVTQLSFQTGLDTDAIMRLILSHKAAINVNNPVLTPEVFYAFLRQNLPANLPGDLLLGSSDWETIDQLTESAASGILFLDDSLHQATIDNAISQNLVSQTVKKDRENILAAFKESRTSFTLIKPILIGNENLKNLLELSKIDEPHYTTVAQTFIMHRGINPDFWEDISKEADAIGADAVKDFTATVELGNITKNHLPTISFIKNNLGTEPGKKFKKTSDLAKLDTEQLVQLIKDNGSKIPDNIPGDTVEEKVNTYASILKSRAEVLYPTTALVASVKRSGDAGLDKISDIENFLDAHDDLNFREANFDKYLLDKGINMDAKTRGQTKMVQRVHKLTTDASAGAALLQAGLNSSAQIYFLGKDRLASKLDEKGIDAKKSNRLFEIAKMQYAQVLAKFLDISPAVNLGTPQAINTISKKEIQDTIADIPDLETLFGSLDYCDSEECQSLYGPAAYLTDLLRFLNEHNALEKENGQFLTVRDILLKRRPDIQNIKLNCENTNTPMPYIDLVCEILENNINPQQIDFSLQTTLSQEELRAAPQYIRPLAYNVLAKADYPMNSSFNLWQEEARTYLNFLRVPRYQMMEAFQNTADENAKKPTDAVIAAEYFGISSYEHDLIVTKRDATADQNKYWNLDTTQSTVTVTEFMNRTKLTYYEVLDLLMVRFINDPNAPNKTVIERPADTFDTDVQKLTNLTVQKFDLMHRFIRLWRKTGWKMWELDLLVRNAGIGKSILDNDALTNLKRFRQLCEKQSLSLEVALVFYDNINTEERIKPDKPEVILPTLYSRLFQNTGITNPVDAHFQLPLDETLLLGVNHLPPAPDYTPVPTILSALAITQSDFELLVPNTNGHLSLASLSTLLRHVYLARSLRLSVKDWLLFLSLTKDDPFSSTKATLDCIQNLEYIKASGFSLQELNYTLNYDPDSYVGLRIESITQYITALRKILSDNKEAVDQLGLSAAQQNQITGFDTTVLPPMTDAQVVTAIAPLKALLNSVVPNFNAAKFSVEETTFILQFGNDPITPGARSKLVQSIQTLSSNLSHLLDQNANQIKSHISVTFYLTDEQSDLLLTRLSLTAPTSLLDVLKNESLLQKNADGSFIDITTANYPDHFKAYTLLHKCSLLLQKMNMDIKDAKWFINNAAAVNTIDFSSLPVQLPGAPVNNFPQWLNLYKFISFRSVFPEPEDVSLRSILDLAKNIASTKASIFSEIEKLTRWSETDLSDLDAGLSLKHEFNAVLNKNILDYANADTYIRLQKIFAQIKLAGKDAETLLDWTQKNDDLQHDRDVAQDIRQAVKSKYEQTDWLTKIGPLNDVIRDKKRAALVAYHIEDAQRNQNPTVNFNGNDIPNPLYWKDSNALFKYLLIDVEMGPLVMTSRIKQAISSVQLFVQRCFLNLENRYVKVSQDEKDDVSSPNAWSQWKWMKNYRIWEANRKVFFYPENWIEPELRDDKSPFFDELEKEIMQKEVIQENVEEAFLNYLHKVDEVSSLEVCGLYHEMEDLSPAVGFERNLVHVIGRTKSSPAVYYYRCYDMNYSTWSAWEKIDVDIVGDHVVPVVYNRKLHLFWLTFMEKPMKAHKSPAAKATTGPTDTPEPMKVLEVQLGWTVKKTKGWSTKKISKQKLIHPWERPHYSYNLKPYYNAKLNELYLDIYISTSKEFNSRKFYDPFQTEENNPVSLTGNSFNETFLPWHSSSFIFNGEVKEVKMKALAGSYHFEFTSPRNALVASDSFEYVNNNFSENRSVERLSVVEFGPRLRLPNGMHFYTTKLRNNLNHNVNTSQLRVLENNTTQNLMNAAISPFELVITQQDLQLNTLTDHPVFYQDMKRAFFVKPEWQDVLDNYGRVQNKIRKYRFLPFYHPYTTLFIRELNRSGIDGLLTRKIQTNPQSFAPSDSFDFSSYSPTGQTVADATAQKDIVDFSFGGAMSIYNWELFFHAPLMIACRLSQNQRFEEAMRWFHYIFNPTDVEDLPTPQRYWITKPFFEYNSDDYRKQRIENILSNINLPDYQEQLKAWRNNPFKPHLIARYRPVAYQKNVVMKYLNNIIAWADQLFRRDTIESINEASLLYMLAYEILGERPQRVPDVAHKDLSFKELEAKLDEFGNAKVDVLIENTLSPIEVVASTDGDEPMPKIDTFYFTIPNNDLLLNYWDTVEDRLFKIRNSMNIEGIFRQLPLFEPPIDPALLVKAAAAGVDLSSVLDEIATATPNYRFRVMYQRAVEFCNDVKQLGDKLLSVLEKKDAEELSLLRSQQEIQLLKAIKEIKEKQVDEAVESIGSLNQAKALAESKKDYYESREAVNVIEGFGLGLSGISALAETAIALGHSLAGGLALIPDFVVGASGFGGSPVANVKLPTGTKLSMAAQFAVETLSSIAAAADKNASLLYTIAGYVRRKEEWDFQAGQAKIEIDQLQFQINAATIRQAIAEKDLDNQELQIENAGAVDDYLRNKYTNNQLYNWMIGQVSTIYFQAYQLAYDMAKKAETCYQYELGILNSNFIQFGYWDSLKKGLMAGDSLLTDLRRLEASYLDINKREFEITKHISLAQVFPLSLITLKETGQCSLSLPEWIFDMDYSGHYMRRLRNVSVSIPCVAGPYTSINCTLSLIKNKTRMDNTLSGGKYEEQEDDTRFQTRYGSITSIATSHAQNDNGMFELNFNDDRYLPFEGAGVISDWQINLPKTNNQFDFASLSDVILHISYSARSGGGELTTASLAYLQTLIPDTAARLFSLKHEFATEWYKFLNPVGGADQELTITLKPELFPFYVRSKLNILKIKKLDLFIESNYGGDFNSNIKLTNTAYINGIAVSPDPSFSNVHHSTPNLAAVTPNALGDLSLKLKLDAAGDFKSLTDDKINDCFILIQLGN